jgi:putative transposase
MAEVAKRHGVSQPTIDAWRKELGQLYTDDVKRVKGRVCDQRRVFAAG